MINELTTWLQFCGMFIISLTLLWRLVILLIDRVDSSNHGLTCYINQYDEESSVPV